MKHFTYIFLLALAVLVAGCSDNEFEFSENYDIKEPVGTDLKTKLRFRLGRKSVSVKMEKLIELLKKNGYHFVTFNEIININKIGK